MRAFEYHAETFVNIRDEIFFVSHCNGTILSLYDNKHNVYYRQGKIKDSDCKPEPPSSDSFGAFVKENSVCP